jgi:hypothetical protein
MKVCSGKLSRETEYMGKMDPFVQIMYLNNKYETKVREDGGKSPVWNEIL